MACHRADTGKIRQGGNTMTVPSLSIAFMIVDMAAGILLPLFLFFWFRKKYHCSWQAFLTGCLVFLLFAMVLERIVHYLVLQVLPVGPVITGNIWLYGIYGGLAAGLFEESGRYLAFRTVLKKFQDNDANALMYGAGHGGFEMFLLITLGMLNNLIYSILLNTGNTQAVTSALSGDALNTVQAAFTQLTGTSPWLFLLSLAERGAALTAQIAMSVLVWFAAKRGGKCFLLFPLAILFHFLLDAVAVICSPYLANTALVEGIIWVMAIGIAFVSLTVWRNMFTSPGK